MIVETRNLEYEYMTVRSLRFLQYKISRNFILVLLKVFFEIILGLTEGLFGDYVLFF